jgi:hypothetical protein
MNPRDDLVHFVDPARIHQPWPDPSQPFPSLTSSHHVSRPGPLPPPRLALRLIASGF